MHLFDQPDLVVRVVSNWWTLAICVAMITASLLLR